MPTQPIATRANLRPKWAHLRVDQRTALSSKMKGLNLENMDKKYRAVHKEEATEAVKLLTAEQQQKFAELIGKEFDLTKIDDYVTPAAK
jgi:hypothetical protein